MTEVSVMAAKLFKKTMEAKVVDALMEFYVLTGLLPTEVRTAEIKTISGEPSKIIVDITVELRS